MVTDRMLVNLLAESPASVLAEAAPGGGVMGFLPIVLMCGVVYFLILRPMSKQEKDRKKRLEALKKGDRVVLAGGILGRISNLDDKIAVVEVADRVRLKVLRKEVADLHVEDNGEKSPSKPATKAAKDGKQADAS